MTPVDDVIFSFRRNVICGASAGTGKTYRLTGLYVLLALGLTSMGEDDDRILAPALPPSRIVATTFSRAAAKEMRGRIELLLASIARGEPTSLDPVIAARCAIAVDPPDAPEIARRARRALDEWGASRIETLHGFAGDLLRGRGSELGLGPDARIEGEDEGRELTRVVVDDVLSERLEVGGEAAEAVRDIVRIARGLPGARDRLRMLFERSAEDGVDLTQLSLAPHRELAAGAVADLREVARRAAGGDVKPALRAAASAVGPAIDDGLAGERFAEALAAFFAVSLARREDAYVDADVARLKAPYGTTNAARSRAFVAYVADALQLEAIEARVLGLVSEIARRTAAERERRGLMSFGDLLRHARTLLAAGGPGARAIRSEIDALLVDEFQDTSVVQRDLVVLLRQDGGDASDLRSIKGSGLFVVGDRKQSIYGFRGVDVSVFAELCLALGGVPAHEALGVPVDRALPALADYVSLRESRRSAGPIVEFVNAFSRLDFAGAEGDGTFEIRYTEAEHLVAGPVDEPAHVTVVADGGSDLDGVDPSLVAGQSALREAIVAAFAARHLVASRGLAFSQIAVLARSRRMISLLEFAFELLELPHVVAGRALYGTREVRDVSALLRLIVDPTDRHALAIVLRGPLVAATDAGLLSLCDDEGIDVTLLEPTFPRDALDGLGAEGERIAVFRRTFLRHRPALLRLVPARAITRAIELFEMDRILAAMPRGNIRIGNVDRLVSIATEQGGTVFGFSRWLARQIDDETDESEAAVFSPEDDAIRVLTIHAAKGLDFEGVVVVDLSATARGRFDPITYDASRTLVLSHQGDFEATPVHKAHREIVARREAAERRRLTYVALTRAKRELVLVGTPSDVVKGSAGEILFGGSALPVETIDERALVVPSPAPPVVRPVEPAEVPDLAAPPRVRRLPLATTALSVFRDCARRYELRFVRGLAEPVPTGQLELFDLELASPERDDVEPPGDVDDVLRAVERGRAAHRVLELWPLERFGRAVPPEDLERALAAEGVAPGERGPLAAKLAKLLASPFAASVARARRVDREQDFAIDVGADPTLRLRGVFDLVVTGEDGVVDVVDYKLARWRKDLSAYAFQLRTYGLAAAEATGLPVRASIVFLGDDPTPVALPGSGHGSVFTEEDHDAFRRELSALAVRFAEARGSARFGPVPLPTCREIRCGFVTACHAGGPRRGGARRGGQS